MFRFFCVKCQNIYRYPTRLINNTTESKFAMSLLKSIQSSIQRSSKELYFLTKQCIKHKPTSRIDIRQMLLETQDKYSSSDIGSTAGGGNAAITLNLLKLDKEVNLMQYHGLREYVKKHVFPTMQETKLLSWFGQSSSSSSSSSSNNNDANRQANSSSSSSMNHNNQQKATVAFMITSQQRQILMSELDYTKEQIKKMKPNEAQIILQHSIHATATAVATSTSTSTSTSSASTSTQHEQCNDSWKEIVQNILREEEEKKIQFEKQQQQQEATRIVRDNQESNNTNQINGQNDILSIGFEENPSINPTNGTNNKTTASSESSSSLLLSQGTNAITNEIEKMSQKNENESFENKNIWYEVVESSTSSNTEEEAVVGLCKSKEEAEELLQIKEELAIKQRNSSTKSLTPTQSDENTFFIRIRNI